MFTDAISNIQIMQTSHSIDRAMEPCPFCLSKEQHVYEIDGGVWAVCCDSCHSIGPHSSSDSEAKSKWANRPRSGQLPKRPFRGPR